MFERIVAMAPVGCCSLRGYGIIICSVFLCGCDYARQGSQRVEVSVTQGPSGRSVIGATVTYAPKERAGPTTVHDLDLAEYLARFDDLSKVTDSSGRASFIVPVHTMRGGLFVWLRLDPLELEDKISGETYYFRVKAEESEILAVQMVPGSTVEGEHFAVTIDAVAPAPPENLIQR